MRLGLLSAVSFLLIPAVLGQAALQKFKGERQAGSYIVKFKKGADRTPLINELGGNHPIHHKYSKTIFNGFAGKLNASALQHVRNDPSVETVFEDGFASAAGFLTQTDAPWGLERISHRPQIVPHSDALSYNYTRDDRQGDGVDVYILDTGVYVEHVEFEGRARWGASFSTANPEQEDNNGHGTHCAGTVGSRKYGVAKKADLIAVKVLGDDGNGLWSDIIAGMDYVVQQKQATGRPSVISMSITGISFQPVDDAVAACTNAGIHIIVAAGNFNDDVKWYSPARAPSAVTVGSTDIADVKADLSNYGAGVDIHGPGVDVYSTWIGDPNASSVLSGTSMATPHVAGLFAYYISVNGDSSPAAMQSYLQNQALSGVISGLPSGTINLLAQNGVQAIKKRGQVVNKEFLGRGRYYSRGERFGKRKIASV